MKKLLKIIGLVLIAGALVTLIIINIVKSSEAEPETVWDEGTTLGDIEHHEHHYILYTDISCHYCYQLGSILTNYSDEFQKFLNDNNVLFEFRVIPFLGSDLSYWGAEATSCASDDGRFWDYYGALMLALGKDYFEPAEESAKIDDTEYFVNVGRTINMSDNFNTCLREHKKRDSIRETNDKALRKISSSSGVPYAKFGKYVSGGFDHGWGWNKALQMLESGL